MNTTAEVIDFSEQEEIPEEQPNVFVNGVRIINLTKHEIYLRKADQTQIVVIPPSGDQTRVHYDRNGTIHRVGFQTYKLKNPTILGLPKCRANTIFLVSPIVRMYLTFNSVDRPDVMSPYAMNTENVGGKKLPCASALAQ